MTTQTTDRTIAIRDIVQEAIKPILSADKDRSDANKLRNDASEKGQGARERVLLALATASATEQWSAREIEAASSEVVRGINDKSTAKTVSTYLSEARKAMHPKARAHVEHVISYVTNAWEAEAPQKEKPLRKAFQRRYHAIVETLGSYIADAPIEDESALIAYARIHDPALDTKKVAKQVSLLRSTLEGIVVHFPCASLRDAIASLGTVDEQDLINAVERKATKAAAVKPVVAEVKVEPAEGASDVLQQALDNMELAA